VTRLLAVLMLLVGAAPWAGASPQASDPPRIVPWHEIGNIGLGMSRKRVERVYGHAVNGNPPLGSVIWRYWGRGEIEVEYWPDGTVQLIGTSSPAYTTRSGVRAGMRIPRGPCHRIAGKCQYHWHGFTLFTASGPKFLEWQRISTQGPHLRVFVQLNLGPGGIVDEIWLSQYLHCSWGDAVARSCVMPSPPPAPPPPAGTRYCIRPTEGPSFLAASPDVPCSTARGVSRRLYVQCVSRARCVVEEFTCIAMGTAGAGVPFEEAQGAECHDGRRTIVIGRS